MTNGQVQNVYSACFWCIGDSVACLIWVTMSTWLLENIRKRDSNAPSVFLCVSCSVYSMWPKNICISSKEIPYRARGVQSHWIIAVPNFYDFNLRNGGNYLGCNHWTCRKAKNLQYIYLDLTGVYLLKDSVLWWIKIAWQVRSEIPVKCAAVLLLYLCVCHLDLWFPE